MDLRGVGGAAGSEGGHSSTLYAHVDKLKIFLKRRSKYCVLQALGLAKLDFRGTVSSGWELAAESEASVD